MILVLEIKYIFIHSFLILRSLIIAPGASAPGAPHSVRPWFSYTPLLRQKQAKPKI